MWKCNIESMEALRREFKSSTCSSSVVNQTWGCRACASQWEVPSKVPIQRKYTVRHHHFVSLKTVLRREKKKKKKKRAAFICTNGENWNVLNCNIKNRQKLHGIKSTLSQKSLNRNVLTVTKYTLSIWTERGSSLFGLSYLCVTAFRSIRRGTY